MGETSSAASATPSPAASPSRTPAREGSPADLRARTRALSNRPWARELAAVAFVCVASLVMAAVAMQLWASPDLHVPFVTGGDGLAALASFKGIKDWGWIWTNGSLGAPGGQVFYDYGSYGPDNLHWAFAWVLERLGGAQPGTVYNSLVLLTFPASGTAAYGVMRALRVSRLAAVAPAALFAVAPYHVIRGEVGHIFLADTTSIPIGVYLALAIMLGIPLFGRRAKDGGPRLLRWASGRSIVTVLLIVFVASTGVYYAAFAVLFVLMAGCAARLVRHGPDGRAALLTMTAVVGGIGVVLVFNLAPTVLYHHAHGPNPAAGTRSPNESLVYGLNLIGQILPPPDHRFGPFASLGGKFWNETTSQSEGPTWGGTLSVLGILMLTASLLAGMAGGRAPRLLGDPRMRATALVMAAAAFLGATGAGGAMIAYVVNPSLRGWNRIGIVITFCGILACAFALDALRGVALRRGRRSVLGFAAIVPVLLVVGTWDQTTPHMKPDYEKNRAEWSNDAHFVSAISAVLGGRGEIYQIPYLPFPESPPVLGMTDYSPFKGYIHASKNIKWSYGAMKGRPADWQGEASQLPLDTQIRAVALAGFDGLWIDNYAYNNPLATVVAQSQAAAGVAPILSADKRLVFFDLRPLRARLAKELPAATVASVEPQLTHPLDETFGAGFYPPETKDADTWNWAANQATITLSNPLPRPRDVTFSAKLSAAAKSAVTFALDGRRVARKSASPPPGTSATFVIRVPTGQHTLTMSANAPRTTPAPGDTRDLRIQVIDPAVEDSALARLASPAKK